MGCIFAKEFKREEQLSVEETIKESVPGWQCLGSRSGQHSVWLHVSRNPKHLGDDDTTEGVCPGGLVRLQAFPSAVGCLNEKLQVVDWLRPKTG